MRHATQEALRKLSWTFVGVPTTRAGLADRFYRAMVQAAPLILEDARMDDEERRRGENEAGLVRDADDQLEEVLVQQMGST